MEQKSTVRKSGILLPIFSLPSSYGIGTLGKQAYSWIRFLEQAGQRIWQVLPIGPTGYGDSPYQSFSAFAGNPYFIDLDLLAEMGLLNLEEYVNINFADDDNHVNYGKLYQNRLEVLNKAYFRFKNKAALQEFENKNPWVTDYALFMVAKEKFGQISWQEWPKDFRMKTAAAENSLKTQYEVRFEFYVFLQYIFFAQWHDVKQYAKTHHVQIIGDLPIYVALDSADVWANQALFELDANGHPINVAGCPPDSFSQTGQLWGNPLYRWDVMKKDGYQWWMQRIAFSFELFDGIRIDHFRGFESYYSIPASEKTAQYGHWVTGPGMGFMAHIQKHFPDANIIAENLGFLTKEVEELLRASGFPGMKILQFAFDSRESSDYMPYNYEKNSVVYTGTHDNQPIAGWLKTAAVEDVALAKKYLDCQTKDTKDCVRAFVKQAMSSVSNVAIIPLQDWLALGDEARINTPAKPTGNWQWRATIQQLEQISTKAIKDITQLYGRI